MQIFHNMQEWQQVRKSIPSQSTIGFVPTMGNLHAGHAFLYQRCRQENDITIASLFVNPTQFNRSDDYQNYPRTLEADLTLLRNLGVNYCLLPDEQAMYPDSYRYQLQETELCQQMEGKHRPGHFNGVLTVVMKLLNLTKPDKAYFGEKDYQQFLLIRDMVSAFFMDIQVIPCPTIRESSGLAYSSRNNRLTPEQRLIAEQFAGIFQQAKPCAAIQTELEQAGIAVEYLEEHQGRRFIAVTIGDVRLIDNYPL
ncbi:pantoate--beta-alanine ligase [Legionella dresdenensis]|uniref:Pantothenate synthetase n=1 Tax=Legionella dresdenensis TaxID=450200 RepID=A0ABV8CF82_9GAMM